MSARKKLSAETRRLRELSLENGVVSPVRVDAVLTVLRETRKPAELRPLLRAYLAVIRREIAKSEARVDHAGDFPEAAKAALAATFQAAYGRPVAVVTRRDDALVAGFRARVGDDVYDASVAGHLDKLSAALG